jgi:hypothetical protein
VLAVSVDSHGWYLDMFAVDDSLVGPDHSEGHWLGRVVSETKMCNGLQDMSGQAGDGMSGAVATAPDIYM